MNQDPVTISHIDWLRVFPALHLWKAVRMGFRFRVLVPCLIGLLAVLVLQRRGIIESVQVDYVSPWTLMAEVNDIWRVFSPSSSFSEAHRVTPLWQVPVLLLQWSGGSISTGRAFFPFIIYALIIAFVGVAVARSTAGEFCVQQRIGAIVALRFSGANFRNALVSLGIAVFLAGLFLLPMVLAGWLGKSSFASQIVMLMWLPLLIASSVCLLGVTVGCVAWLLSLGAIGTDECDGSDALSRGTNYVLSRPLMACCYVSIVCMLSMLAEIMATVLMRLSVSFLNGFTPVLTEAARRGKGYGLFEGTMHWSIELALLLGPSAVQLGVFCSGITIAYTLLRQAEDAVYLREMDGGKPKNAARS